MVLSSTNRLLAADTVPPVLSQASAPEGSAALTLTVNGSNFASDATVQWNNAALATTVLSSSQLQATIPAADLAEEGMAVLSVATSTAGGGTITPQTFAITDAPLAALPMNFLPVMTTEGVSSGPQLMARFTDPGTDGTINDYTATIFWGDGTSSAGTVTLDTNGGFDVTGSHTYAQEGPYNTSVQINDVGGSTLTAGSLRVVADAALHGSAAPVTATEGVALGSTVLASFTDDNPTATAGEFTATIQWGDGTSSAGTVAANTSGGFNVLGSHTYAEDGAFATSIQITDAGGSTLNSGGSVHVVDAPLTALSTPTLQFQEGGLWLMPAARAAVSDPPLQLQTVARFSDPGSDGTTADYGATILWGDGTSSTGIIMPDATNGFDVLGWHDYARPGSYTVGVQVTDVGGSTLTTSNTATVADGTLTAAGTSVSGTEGVRLSGAVASFSDENWWGGMTGDYTATIKWGDGTSSTGTIASNLMFPPPPGGPQSHALVFNGGGYNVLGSHTYAEGGTYAVSVTIQDDDGDSVTAHSTAAIADAPLTASGFVFSATEGQKFSGGVASFGDAKKGEPLSQYSATINWGDGTSSSGTIVSAGTNGSFSVQGTHTYAMAGGYQVQIMVKDQGGASATSTSWARVADVALTAAGKSIAATEGMLFTGPVASFTDADLLAKPGDYWVSITWGDGSNSAGSIVAVAGSPGSFQVLGGHMYTEEGTYATSVKITDRGGSKATVSGKATVADAPLQAVFKITTGFEGNAVAGTVATFTDGDPNGVIGNYKASIDWGDGVTTAGTIKANVLGGWKVNGSHTYAKVGEYKARVTVTDTGGASAVASATVSIADAPLIAIGSQVHTTEGAAFKGVVASFDDADPHGMAGQYSALITWGDGSSSPGTVVAHGDGFDVQGTHTYTHDGVFQISVKIKDVDGATATSVSPARVDDAPLLAAGSTITAAEGIALTTTVATFTDANPAATASDFTATIKWGDGTSSAGTILAKGGGKFAVQDTHTYSKVRGYAVTVQIADKGGSQASAKTTITIQDSALSASGTSIQALPKVPFSGAVASFTDADSLSTAAKFSALINWGDGHTGPGTIQANGNGGFTVSGSHSYASLGTYQVTVTIKDADGSTATAHSTAHVVQVIPVNKSALDAVFGTHGL